MRLGSESQPQEPGRRAHAPPAPRCPPNSSKPGWAAARRALTQPGGTKGRTQAPAASARLLEWLAPGRSGHRAGRVAGHPAPGRCRGRARFLSAHRARSLLCHSPRLRTGQGTGSPVATGKEGALAEPASDVGPQPGTQRPLPGQKTEASGEAQTGADQPPSSLRFA